MITAFYDPDNRGHGLLAVTDPGTGNCTGWWLAADDPEHDDLIPEQGPYQEYWREHGTLAGFLMGPGRVVRAPAEPDSP
jgi:hypothetical protein